MRGRGWNNRGEMRWEFFGRRPLIEARIRPAPHRHFSVTKRLLRQPFDYVVTVARLVGEWLELAGRITAAANVHQHKDITV